MDRVTDGFIWPVRDPEWLPKLAITALILLIPIVGGINAIGWMLATLDRLRAGEERMAPANLSYLGRGVRLFVVQLAYGVAVAAIAILVYLPGLLIAINQGKGEGNPSLIAVAILLNLLAFGVATIGGLGLTFASPAIVLATDRGGMAAGLDAPSVWRRMRSNLNTTLIAGLMLIAASFVSSLGALVCIVGVLFTVAYALAIQAWIFHSYELGSNAST